MARVLVIDDEPNMRWVLQEALERAGYTVLTAPSGEEALVALTGAQVDLIMLDLKMKGMDGLATLRQIHHRYPDVVILILTAYGTLAMAVEALQGGASDFLRKPFDVEEVLFKIGRALERRAMQQELLHLRAQPVPPLIGAHPHWRRACTLAVQGLSQNLDLRLVGEPGSGRATIARVAHATAPQRTAPLIEVDLETLPADRQADLLVGTAERPGFWALAGQGALLLRHIGSLSPAGLAALESYAARSTTPHMIMTGSAQEWAALDQAKALRPALTVPVPPLREHIDDLLLFAAVWIPGGRISPTTQDLLHAYPWPGNLAELRGVLERAATLAGTGPIEEQHLPASVRTAPMPDTPIRLPREGVSLELVEQSLIRQALVYAGGNKSRAAELLGLTRHTLLYRLAKYQIADP